MIVHLIHYPVSAKRFVEPLVRSLNAQGFRSELWFENRPDVQEFSAAVDCPKRFAQFDLSINPAVSAIRLVRLVGKFLRFRPEAIHAHQTRAAFIPLLAARLARIPVRIYQAHGTPYLGYHGPLRCALWLLEFLNCRLATHVLTVSHSIRNNMIQHRLAHKSKCHVLGRGSACGIDLAEFSEAQFDSAHRLQARCTLGIAPGAYVVLYVGRPRKRKGFHALLAAWAKMRVPGSRDVLLVAGCTQTDVVGVSGGSVDNVVALGYLKDLRACYAASDVVVLPSWHEGFPYSLLEGAAAGRALVGSDIPGIDSIVTSENGLRVPTGDAAALANALLVLKDDPALRERMGCLSRQYVEQCFDRRDLERFLFDYYRRIGIESNATDRKWPSRSEHVPDLVPLGSEPAADGR